MQQLRVHVDTRTSGGSYSQSAEKAQEMFLHRSLRRVAQLYDSKLPEGVHAGGGAKKCPANYSLKLQENVLALD